jgi:hypothetical protein
MGMPVKLSDDLVEAARSVAAIVDRSITSQIEHWAKIGRAVEALVSQSEIIALKSADIGGPNSPSSLAAQEAMKSLLLKIAISPDRSAVLDMLTSRGKPVYGTDPAWPGMLVRFDQDGTKVPGQLKNRRFVPAKTKAATRSR